jgi:hypothetical protein
LRRFLSRHDNESASVIVKRAILLTAVGAAAVVAFADDGATAPSRIVDRTLVCTPVQLGGGVRDLNVVTSPRNGPLLVGTVRAVSVGYIGVFSGAHVPDADLVVVRARTQERYQQQPQPPGVYANFRRCSRARATISLSPRGLPGPPVEFGTHGECGVRGRVLVRVRAVLQSPTSWLPAVAPYAGARKDVLSATIALRSERTRRPIALIQLGRSGTTRLWTSAGCS